MKKIQILAVLVIFITSGCATKTESFNQHFRPTEFVTKILPEYDGMPHGEVFIMSGQKEFEKFIDKQPTLGNPADLFLGWLMLYGPEFTPGVARIVTAQCGGDKYICATARDGKEYLNMLWVRASPARQRELLSLGAINFPRPNPAKSTGDPQPRKTSGRTDLLLNDSTL